MKKVLSWAFLLISFQFSLFADYTITTQLGDSPQNADGDISPKGIIEVTAGSSKNFTITPDPGYLIERVTINKLSNGSSTDLIIEDYTEVTHTLENINSDFSITATFTDNRVEVMATVDSIANQGSITPGPHSWVAKGQSKTFTITPEENYVIERISVYDFESGDTFEPEITNPEGMQFTLNDIQGNTDISVAFTDNRVEVMTTVDSIANQGSITPGPHSWAAKGQSKTFTITPEENYVIERISIYDFESGDTFEPEITNPEGMQFTLNDIQGNTDISVAFSRSEGVIGETKTIIGQIGNSPHNNQGSMSISNTPTDVEKGSAKTFTVAPWNGFQIEKITIINDDNQEVMENVIITNPLQMTHTIQNIQSNIRVIATFIEATHTITPRFDQNGYISPEQSTQVLMGRPKTFTITPHKGYRIETISIKNLSTNEDSLIPVTNKFETHYTFESVTNDYEISATFEIHPIIDFDADFRGTTNSLYNDLVAALEICEDEDTIQFNSDVTIPFSQELVINKAVNLIATESANVIFDGQHQTRILTIALGGDQVPTHNGLFDMSIEGISFIRGNNVSSWEKVEADGSMSSITFNPLSNTWTGATAEEVTGIGSKSTIFEDGGAVYAQNVNLTLNRSSIKNSYSAGLGAALFLYEGQLVINNTNIENNMASIPLAASYPSNIGGGILGHFNIDKQGCSLKLENTSIKDNSIKIPDANNVNGCVLFSQFTSLDSTTPLTIKNNKIYSNKVFTFNCIPLIKGLTINHEARNSEFLRANISENIVSNTQIIGSANVSGGGFYISSSGFDQEINFVNNTITDISAGDEIRGSAINIFQQGTGPITKLNLYHNTIINNSSSQSVIDSMYGQEITLHGNLIAFNNSELKIDNSLSISGGYNYINETGYTALPDDLPTTQEIADLDLNIVSLDGIEMYFIPNPASPLIDATQPPAILPIDVNIDTDVLGNSFNGLSRDVGSLEQTSDILSIMTSTGEDDGFGYFVNNEGLITIDGDSTVNFGESKSFTITPDYGFIIDSISVINTNSQLSRSIAVTDPLGMNFTLDGITSDTEVNATFRDGLHSVNSFTGIQDEHGYNIKDNGDITTQDNVIVEYDGSITFQITPHLDHLIESVYVKNLETNQIQMIEVTDILGMTHTIENVTQEIEIHATFVFGRNYVHTVTGLQDEYGYTYNDNGDITTQDDMIVEHNGSITFQITPHIGYLIDKVFVKNLETNQISIVPVTNIQSMTHTINNITQEMEIHATFVDGRHHVITSIGISDGQGGWIKDQGMVSTDDDQIVMYNGSVTFDIQPHNGYIIENITVKKIDTGTEATPTVGNPNGMFYTVSNVTEEMEISVTFIPGPKIEAILHEFIDPETQMPTIAGSISPEGITDVLHNDSQSYSIVADENYMIKEVLVNSDPQEIGNVSSSVMKG